MGTLLRRKLLFENGLGGIVVLPSSAGALAFGNSERCRTSS
jgi:hypothetical protein